METLNNYILWEMMHLVIFMLYVPGMYAPIKLLFIIMFTVFYYDNRLLWKTLNYIMKMLLLFVVVVVVVVV